MTPFVSDKFFRCYFLEQIPFCGYIICPLGQILIPLIIRGLSVQFRYLLNGILLCQFLTYCKCRSLGFNRYSILDWNLPPAPIASGWKVREGLLAWTPVGANSVFFKSCETDVLLCGLLARQKEVSTWILLNWFDLNHHFRGVSFFGTFMSAFVLFQFSRGRMYAYFCAEHLRK